VNAVAGIALALFICFCEWLVCVVVGYSATRVIIQGIGGTSGAGTRGLVCIVILKVFLVLHDGANLHPQDIMHDRPPLSQHVPELKTESKVTLKELRAKL
jgi:hypothetical protein